MRRDLQSLRLLLDGEDRHELEKLALRRFLDEPAFSCHAELWLNVITSWLLEEKRRDHAALEKLFKAGPSSEERS